MTNEASLRSHPELHALVAHFLKVFSTLDDTSRRLALAIYRGLSEGNPVSAAELATIVQPPHDGVAATLSGWPGVYYDDQRRVIGFWGLTIVPMPHRLRIGDRTLYAWCAWDTLFLPELIGMPLEV
jgi:alkylmercury lyase